MEVDDEVTMDERIAISEAIQEVTGFETIILDDIEPVSSEEAYDWAEELIQNLEEFQDEINQD